MNVTYKNGFLKAEDVAGVTNGNNLTQTNATGENVPVTTTIDQLASNYKGDLVLLSQVTIYNDATGDLGTRCCLLCTHRLQFRYAYQHC